MNRVLLYVHFNKFNRLSGHVEYQLSKLRDNFSKVIFISNSTLNATDQERLVGKRLIDVFVQRENSGFDFAAWKDGMDHIGFEKLNAFDSVTIMNDTCFGPFWDLNDWFKKYDNADVDFWGMTNHRATETFLDHIQSYFVTFKNAVLKSDVFKSFWENISEFSDVQHVINEYETKLTALLIENGFKYDVVFDTRNEDVSHILHPDFSYYDPTTICKKRVPFLKVKAIDANQHIIPYILDDIDRQSDYPIELIVEHMSDVTMPDYKYLLARKLLKTDQVIEKDIQGKIAVHLHVFYPDLLSEFITAFNNFSFDYDLYITTDTENKKSEILSLLSGFSHEVEIHVTGNVGRDILPMLLLKEKLSQYDYVGHFHTKKSKEADFWAGESWRKELIDMLVKPADNIIQEFETSSVGIVIADIPTFFRFNKIVTADNEHGMTPEMERLWKKMSVTKTIDFSGFNTFVMSYGTFVWFKYDALAPLFDLALTAEDVPAEPLPQNSVLHAIERMLIYIAWARHYDFRISKNTKALSSFIDNKALNERTIIHVVEPSFRQLVKWVLKKLRLVK